MDICTVKSYGFEALSPEPQVFVPRVPVTLNVPRAVPGRLEDEHPNEEPRAAHRTLLNP
jgi:hypothetical protein